MRPLRTRGRLRMGGSNVELSALWTWSELSGSAPVTHETFVAHLKQFQPSILLTLCSRVGLVLASGPPEGSHWVSQLELANQFLPAPIAGRVRLSGKHAFYRTQLLFLSKEIKQTRVLANDVKRVPTLFDFGRLCLESGDLLEKTCEPPKDPLRQAAYMAHNFIQRTKRHQPNDPYFALYVPI